MKAVKDKKIWTVIETPKGSRNKYAYDEKLKAFVLKKILPEGMVFPFNFGFIPETMAGDGDPADVLVLMDEASFPGCHIETKIIGIFQAMQKKKDEEKFVENPRIIGIAIKSDIFNEVNKLQDLGEEFLDGIEHFFKSYLELSDNIYRPGKREGANKAMETINRYCKSYIQKHKS